MDGKFVKQVIVLAVVLSILSATAVFSSQHYYFDLIANFRIHYIVLIAPAVLVAFGIRAYASAIVLTFCLAVHAVTVMEALKATREFSVPAGETIRIMNSNLLKSNQQYQAYVDYIQQIDPDVIVFHEYTSQWDAFFQTALKVYPYRMTLPMSHTFGIAIYSKYQIHEQEVIELFNPELPALKGRISVGDATLHILGAHPTAPISFNRYNMRSRQLTALADEVSDQPDPLVLAGDLNITPWSAHFKSFVERSGLYDGRRGFGVLPTWPNQLFVPGIPIDHIMVNQHVEVLNLQTSERLTGSDHKALWADIRFR